MVRRTRRAGRGFTLIELTVVLAVIALFLTIGMAALSSLGTNQAISETKKKQETIRDALVGYLGRWNRLPCPDSSPVPDGRGDDNRATPGDVTTACGAALGTVPYIELGLSREVATDGWSNFVSYQVVNPTWTVSNNFRVGNAGNITVNTRVTPISAFTVPPLTSTAVVVLVSHGINGSGARTSKGTVNAAPGVGTDEAENLNGDAIFVKRDFTEDTTPPNGAFDDLVLYLSASDLTMPLIQAGSLRTPEGELNRIRNDVRNYILSYAVGFRSFPSALPGTLNVQGPWGGTVVYNRTWNATINAASPCPSVEAYTLTYTDQNGNPTPISVTVDEARALVLSANPPPPPPPPPPVCP